jgi:hypothetical protein
VPAAVVVRNSIERAVQVVVAEHKSAAQVVVAEHKSAEQVVLVGLIPQASVVVAVAALHHPLAALLLD